jgi:hypothetical protein
MSAAFARSYGSIDGDIHSLRRRLQPFIKRTLRRDVLEYVPYTQRHALTTPFSPGRRRSISSTSLISTYLQREFSYGFPSRQKHLVGLILRKLLASSTEAITATLEAIRNRLQKLLDKQSIDEEWIRPAHRRRRPRGRPAGRRRARSTGKPKATRRWTTPWCARSLPNWTSTCAWPATSAKTRSPTRCCHALQQGFERMGAMGAARKAVIFTESRRTQDYLARLP